MMGALLLILLLVSCDMVLLDENGYSPYTVSNLTGGDVLIRCPKGFVVDNTFYKEYITQNDTVVYNPFCIEIELDIYNTGTKVLINPLSECELVVLDII